MKPFQFFSLSLAISMFLLTFVPQGLAQNYPAAHWINRTGQHADTVLSAGNVFTTDFKGTNDLVVTPLTVHSVSIYTDVFGGSSPGNNPFYVTNYLGISSNYTGDGTRGNVGDLEMTYDATDSLQFDFARGLNPADRVYLIDIDGAEQYQLLAYTFDGVAYNPVSVAGWTVENFSGQMGVVPDARWPVWDSAAATLTSASSSMNEELVVLTPDRKIDRLVINKLTGGSYSTDVEFISPLAPLTILRQGADVVCTWPQVFVNLSLYSAPAVTGPWTVASSTAGLNGGLWMQTNSPGGQNIFYRLQWP